MAHKGRLYPYAEFRDLSPPNPLFRNLPKRVVWSGLICTGTRSAPFNAGPFVLEQTYQSYTLDPNMWWQKRVGGTIDLPWVVIVYWKVTRDPRFGLWGFNISAPYEGEVDFHEQEPGVSFPYSVHPVVKRTTDPAVLAVTNPGTVNPKEW